MNGVTGVGSSQSNTNTNQTQGVQSSSEFLQTLISSLRALENTASSENSTLTDTNAISSLGVLLPLELLGMMTGNSVPAISNIMQGSGGSAVNPSSSGGSVGGSVTDIGAIVNQASALYHVPVSLIHGVIQQESGNNPNAVSSAGAMGLMQLMPENAKALGVNNPFDPAQNVMAGTHLLAGLLQRYHNNQSLALAAYNAGAGAVAKYNGIPPYPETQQYVQKVLKYADEYAMTTNAKI